MIAVLMPCLFLYDKADTHDATSPVPATSRKDQTVALCELAYVASKSSPRDQL